MIDAAAIRESSWQIAAKLGFPRNDHLPLLENLQIARSRDEIVDRVFVMNCVAACSYGFDRPRAFTWLTREASVAALTDSERDFLTHTSAPKVAFMHQIEGMWALCYCLQITADLDFSKHCADDFVRMFPDLKLDEPGSSFRSKARLRDAQDVVPKCDLAYCLHWGLVHTALTGKRLKKVTEYVIVERRRALEWVLCKEGWDDVPLDT